MDVSPTSKRKLLDTSGDNRSDDQQEKNHFYRLFGRNEVPFVELWGWTNSIVMGFPDLRTDLKMSELHLPPKKGKELPPDIELLQSIAEKLGFLARGANKNDYMTILCPVFVQVIAKKKVDIMMLKRRKDSDDSEPKTTLVIGNLIVADETGACLVTMFNEATLLVHEKVQVGDTLAIKKGSFKALSKDALKVDYPFQKSLLNLEIKIDKYQVRQVIHIPVQPAWPHRLHNCLFSKEQIENGVKLPSTVWTEIEANLKKTEMPSSKSKSVTPEGSPNSEDNSVIQNPIRKSVPFFDLQGIISYTGRIERVEVFKSNVEYLRDPVKTVETNNGMEKVTGTLDKITSRQFMAFRFVQIVDRTSKPLLVKVFLKKDNMDTQSKLVPGAIVLLTNCQMSQCEYLEDFVSTSVYTQIYCNEELRTYFTLMPENYLKSISENISLKSCREIYGRKDVIWSAGGTIQPKIKSPTEFLLHYAKEDKENGKPLIKKVPKCLGARETLTLFFRGKIIAMQLVTEESSAVFVPNGWCLHKQVYGSRHKVRDMRKKDHGWKSEETLYFARSNDSCFAKRCELTNWIFSRRILPPFQIPEAKSSNELAGEIIKIPQKLCEPLLLPSVMSCSSEEIPELGKCPRQGGFPFYRVTIRDEENEQWYEAVWEGEDFELMKAKWESAKDKVILGLVDIQSFGRGEPFGCNVSLRDFVIEEEVLTALKRGGVGEGDVEMVQS